VEETANPIEIEEHRFPGDAAVPNNADLPLIVYRQVLATGVDAADACEKRFARNQWTGAWHNGIYRRHHYHSTAHEVLGIAAGSARVRFGGEGGRTVAVNGGDVVVVPAGVAHKAEWLSPDLVVVGAYPQGQHPDIREAGARDLARARQNIAAVPRPAADPLYGRDGPLLQRWR
jgi:uncharacterized protein YjlB